MAAAFRISAAGGSSTGTSNRTAVITTLANDLVIVLCHVATNTNAAPTCSDSNGGAYTLVGTALNNASADIASIFVGNALVGTGASTTITVATGSNTSGSVVALAYSGMTKVGLAAIRQSLFQANQAAGTPAPAFPSACLTTNPTIGAISNASNPATMTTPTGWAEQQDVGQTSNPEGLEVVTRDSGFTGTTVTWGSASATAFAAMLLELDGSAATAYSRTPSETLSAATDAVGQVQVLARAIADTDPTASDGLVRQFLGARGGAESMPAPVDTTTIRQALARAVADATPAPLDGVAQQKGFPRAVGESVPTPSDTLTRAQVLARAGAETLAAALDAVVRFQALARARAEATAGPVDGLTRAQVLARGQAESTPAPADALARASAGHRVGAETTPAPADALARALVLGRVASAVLSVADGLARAFAGARADAEASPAPTDAASGLKNGGGGGGTLFSRGPSETSPAPTDALARAQAVARGAAEGAQAPADSAARAIAGRRAQAEAIALADQTARQANTVRHPDEVLPAPTDSVDTGAQHIQAILAEAVALVSDIVRRLQGGPIGSAIGDPRPGTPAMPVATEGDVVAAGRASDNTEAAVQGDNQGAGVSQDNTEAGQAGNNIGHGTIS